MAFTVWQKVVCVDARPPFHCAPNKMPHQLVHGKTYTIRFYDEVSGVLLVEVINPQTYFSDGFGEGHWNYMRFRPLVETKQETSFTVGADPESEKWDNRKPMPVYSFDIAGHEGIMQYLRGFY